MQFRGSSNFAEKLDTRVKNREAKLELKPLSERRRGAPRFQRDVNSRGCEIAESVSQSRMVVPMLDRRANEL